MSKVNFFLLKKGRQDGKNEIGTRVIHGNGVAFRLGGTNIFISPERFRDGEIIFPRSNQAEAKALREIQSQLDTIRQRIFAYIDANPGNVTKEGLQASLNPSPKETKPSNNVFEDFKRFYSLKGLKPGTVRAYNVLERALMRFKAFKELSTGKPFDFSTKNITEALKHEIAAFLKDETPAFALYPQIYEETPNDTRKRKTIHAPEIRSHNYMCTILKKLSGFIRWCNDQGLCDCKPGFSNGPEVYGTPTALTMEEVSRILDADLNGRLAVQRDIFVFQCYVGCRVSDLSRLTPANIGNGMLSYIPQKTEGERAEVVNVPLHPNAAALVEKYKGKDKKGRLFPFIADQKYNDAIKDVLCQCGIDRMVTVVDPKAREQRQRPIYTIGSSHLARRTFINSLYQITQDPNIIGSMSGHVEGSKAFARYRKIEDDIKRNLINKL